MVDIQRIERRKDRKEGMKYEISQTLIEVEKKEVLRNDELLE